MSVCMLYSYLWYAGGENGEQQWLAVFAHFVHGQFQDELEGAWVELPSAVLCVHTAKRNIE